MYTWLRRLFARNAPKTGDTPRIDTTSNLSCKEVVELVSDYLESTLLPEKNQQVEEHLSGCDGCTNYVQQVRMTIGILRNLVETPEFPGQKEELLSLFRAWKRG